MPQFIHPKWVLLVGSLPVPSNEDAFKLLCQTIPGRLASIPDGETGNRHKWVGWQCDVFPQETLKFNSATMLSRRHDGGGIPLPNGHTGVFTQDDVKPSLYDQVEKDSYQKFKELRNQGIIPPGVRFQVSLPTPQASIQAHLRPEFQAPLEPFYEKRIYDAIDSIVEEIPPDDLALQLDLCLEVTSVEYERGRLKDGFFKPYFYPIHEGVLERIQRMADHIPDNVPLGIHPCHGDNISSNQKTWGWLWILPMALASPSGTRSTGFTWLYPRTEMIPSILHLWLGLTLARMQSCTSDWYTSMTRKVHAKESKQLKLLSRILESQPSVALGEHLQKNFQVYFKFPEM